MDRSFHLVRQLVEDFRSQSHAYLSPAYKESQVRQDFIDKFFSALGWDVTHERQKNPYRQEVRIENAVRTEGSQRRADYAFFIDPNFRDVKFFVEAKKPARDLANPECYHQTLRYGWNQSTPLAVLTDFEEFHILDCRYKPNIKTALDHKIELFHYDQYADEEVFKKIYYLFGRDAVAGGSLEEYAKNLGKRRGKGTPQAPSAILQPVDEAFLALLDRYREILAKAFKNRNASLDGEELTEAVQRTIDRLVFMRFLEDKGIEDRSVLNFGYEVSAWNAFLRLCRSLEPKYNGLLFKPHPVIDAPGFAPPEDRVFSDICNELTDRNSEYDFNSIPISILGSIYERFLGKVVVATEKRAKVEDKPEVRKAGGVYYTPEYIVRYIVNETVGKLIEGKTPEQIKTMAFADIACGSGSFLLEVYNRLLEYHTRYYAEHPEKAKKGDLETREGNPVLSHKKRQEILVNNIYGVDIDSQAIEVTQLSLYLKLMEDVTMNDAFQYSLLKERMLPDLRRNIVCGNSLIGRDILEGNLFDDAADHALKPMNFEDAFPEVMKRGGFDAVVGNPPWGVTFETRELNYFKRKYIVAKELTTDSYSLFLEKSSCVSKNDGLVGYIIPDTFLRKGNYFGTRKLLIQEMTLCELIETGPVFSQVRDTWCAVIRLKKRKPETDSAVGHKQISRFIVSAEERLKLFANSNWSFESSMPQEYWKGRPNLIIGYSPSIKQQRIIEKIEKYPRLIDLNDLYRISRGEEGSKFAIKESPQGNIKMITPEFIERYHTGPGIMIGDETNLAPNKLQSFYLHPKIWIIRIQKMRWKQRLVVAFDASTRSAGMKTLQVIASQTDDIKKLQYLNSLLASKLINFWCINYLADDMNQSYLEQIPIRPINFEDSMDVDCFDHIVSLVDQMLKAKEKHAAARTETEKTRLEMQIEALDRQIDKAVYELYGLTEEEIGIVEGTA